MAVFDGEIRHAVSIGSTLGDEIQCRIHSAVHIHAAFAVQPLIVDRTGSIQRTHHILNRALQHFGLRGDAGFVAQRPHHHTGAVFAGFHIRGQPVDICRFQFPRHHIAGSVLGDFDIPFQRVAFHIGRCHHKQAVFIAEVIEILIVGVMRGAHRVDVALLHHF